MKRCLPGDGRVRHWRRNEGFSRVTDTAYQGLRLPALGVIVADVRDGLALLAARAERRHFWMMAGIGALVAAGAPFLSVNFGQDDPRLLPRSFESRTVASLAAKVAAQMADLVAAGQARLHPILPGGAASGGRYRTIGGRPLGRRLVAGGVLALCWR